MERRNIHSQHTSNAASYLVSSGRPPASSELRICSSGVDAGQRATSGDVGALYSGTRLRPSGVLVGEGDPALQLVQWLDERIAQSSTTLWNRLDDEGYGDVAQSLEEGACKSRGVCDARARDEAWKECRERLSALGHVV